MVDKQDRQSERETAIANAKAWWREKDPAIGYVCDACNGPLKWNEEGASLVGSWMRCKRCTDRLFSLAGRTVHLRRGGRSSDIPLNELIWNAEFSDAELFKGIADSFYDPAVLKLRAKRLPKGDI